MTLKQLIENIESGYISHADYKEIEKRINQLKERYHKLEIIITDIVNGGWGGYTTTCDIDGFENATLEHGDEQMIAYNKIDVI